MNKSEQDPLQSLYLAAQNHLDNITLPEVRVGKHTVANVSLDTADAIRIRANLAGRTVSPSAMIPDRVFEDLNAIRQVFNIEHIQGRHGPVDLSLFRQVAEEFKLDLSTIPKEDHHAARFLLSILATPRPEK